MRCRHKKIFGNSRPSPGRRSISSSAGGPRVFKPGCNQQHVRGLRRDGNRRLTSGTPMQEIMAGVQKSVVSRIVGMVGRQAREPFYFTGGVALVPGMAQALSSVLGHEIKVSSNAQFTGALVAAIMASKQ
jgi:hypothetical protein